MTTPKRILVIRTGGVGDFILSLPVIRVLVTTWPDAKLEILGRPAIAALAGSQVASFSSIDDRRFARLFAGKPLDASDPAAAYMSSFDIVVSFLGKPESDFGRKLRALVPRTLFIPAPAARAKHAVVQFLDALTPFVGLSGESGHSIPRVELSAEDRHEGERLVQKLLGQSERPMVVHPGSGGRQKNWPPELFAKTIRLFRQAGYEAILLQGEADEEAVREVLHSLETEQVVVLKGASLVQVAGVIACAQLVIGNDSGISHLAAAMGTPLVCLFGPTDPAVWRPLGANVRVLTFEEATPERVSAEGIGLIE